MDIIMFYAFIENTTILVAIIIFVICVIIGFFGDMYLRKQNKIGRLFEFKKKEKQAEHNEPKETLVERNEPLITSENVNVAPVKNEPVINGTVNSVNQGAAPVSWGSVPGTNTTPQTVSNPQPVPVNNVNGTDANLLYNNVTNSFETQQVVPQDAFGNINQNTNGAVFNHDVQNQPFNGNVNQPVTSGQGPVSPNMFQEIGSMDPGASPNYAEKTADEISVLLKNITDEKTPDINRPAPFDGNLQNDDNINNMF